MFLIDDGTPDLFKSLFNLAKLFIKALWILALYRYIIVIIIMDNGSYYINIKWVHCELYLNT